jgi:hypothetical protein
VLEFKRPASDRRKKLKRMPREMQRKLQIEASIRFLRGSKT